MCALVSALIYALVAFQCQLLNTAVHHSRPPSRILTIRGAAGEQMHLDAGLLRIQVGRSKCL